MSDNMSVEQASWPIIKLDKLITDMQPGFAQRPQPGDDGVPQLRPNNISNSGAIDLSEVKYVRPSITDLEKYLGLPGNDGQVLTSLIDGTREWSTISTVVSWGEIQGTLSNRTDLQAELDLKANKTEVFLRSEFIQTSF